MRLLDRLTRARTITVGDSYFTSLQTVFDGNVENTMVDFVSYVHEAYRSNGVVFAAITARQMLLSEARFKWRNFSSKETFGNADLRLLEVPWPKGTTGKLISRLEQDASLAGNAFVFRRGPNRLQRWRPDWVTIILDPNDHDSVLGYVYQEGLDGPQKFALPEEVAHYAPVPDPLNNFRGQSWLSPVATEILSDKDMTRHKRLFFKNAATPAMVIKHEKQLHPDVKRDVKAALALRHEGIENAYKSMILEGGAEIEIVGANMRQLDFAITQAGGENRIAVASGVPAVALGIKEGLQGSSLNAGNYGESLRRFSDITCRPLWREMSATLQPLLRSVPEGSELWYDTSDIAALRQDEGRQADIDSKKAATIVMYINGGFEPESVVQAVLTGDLSDLVHSGKTSVQLLPTEERMALAMELMRTAGILSPHVSESDADSQSALSQDTDTGDEDGDE